MRKGLLFTILVGVTALMVSCDNPDTQTPSTDTLNMWPAYNDSTKGWGYINKLNTKNTTEFAVRPLFSSVNNFSCGFARVYQSEKEVHFINKYGGSLKLPAKMDDARDFNYNYAAFKQNDYWGFVNKNLQVTIEPKKHKFLQVSDMSKDGLIAAQTSTGNDTTSAGVQLLWGYYNANGEQVIQPQYEYAEAFRDGIAVVKKDGQWGAINTKGEVVIEYTNVRLMTNIGNGFVLYRGVGEFGTIQKDNSKTVFAGGNYQLPKDNDMIPVLDDQTMKWGYRSYLNLQKIESKYSKANPFSEGYAWVKVKNDTEEGWTLINTDGVEVFSKPLLDKNYTNLQLEPMHNGLAKMGYDTLINAEWWTRYQYIDTHRNISTYSWMLKSSN